MMTEYCVWLACLKARTLNRAHCDEHLQFPLAKRLREAEVRGTSDIMKAVLLAAAAELEEGVTIGIVVQDGCVETVRASMPIKQYILADIDSFEGECAGDVHGACSADETTDDRERHAEIRENHALLQALQYDENSSVADLQAI